jgi:hypothetical protein
MSFMPSAKRVICAVLAFSVFNLTLPGVASAAIVSTGEIVAAEQVQIDRAQLKTWLAKQDVQKQLVAMGVDVSAAEERVDQMTDQEVQQMAAHMNEMPAGAGTAEVLVLAFLVLVVLEVTGVTDILPNI